MATRMACRRKAKARQGYGAAGVSIPLDATGALVGRVLRTAVGRCATRPGRQANSSSLRQQQRATNAAVFEELSDVRQHSLPANPVEVMMLVTKNQKLK